MFDADFVIFSSEHALHIASLQRQYASETDRKDTFVQRLIREEVGCGTHWIRDDVLREMREQWSHDSGYSCVDKAQGAQCIRITSIMCSSNGVLSQE